MRRYILFLAVLAGWLVVGAGSAYANRFGPPWQARVAVDQTVLYTQADRASSPVGPLSKGQIIVVTGVAKGPDGADWNLTPDGYVPASDIAEDYTPWIAEVSVPSVSVYAKPTTAEGIRRTARQGDLLRVTGVSPGIEGDTNTWWATTEGYVALRTIRAATSDWAVSWSLPAAREALVSWWGRARSQANVRAAATTDAPIVGRLVAGDRVKVLAEEDGEPVNGNATWYRIDGGRYAGPISSQRSLHGRTMRRRARGS
jgi:hypothetical protein